MSREIAQVVGPIFTIALLVILPFWWWRPLTRWARTPTFWMFPDSVFRGMRRGFGAGAFMFLFGMIAAGLVQATREPLLDRLATEALGTAEVVGVGALGLSLACGVLFITIWLFNWPKMFVPRYLRHEPGAIGEWLAMPEWKERGVRTLLRWVPTLGLMSVGPAVGTASGLAGGPVIATLTLGAIGYLLGHVLGHFLFGSGTTPERQA